MKALMSMTTRTRRDFLARAAAVAGLATLTRRSNADAPSDLPKVDYHVHRDNSTLDQILPLSQERGVKFGIVEHAGTKENVYPVVLSNDDELNAYVDSLEGRGVYKGVQAEWTDWASCFSKKALARLDYVLTDCMTYPGKNGARIKLWEPVASEHIDFSNPERFMDEFVDWQVRIVETQPCDILANVSWLPPQVADAFDQLWTEKRMARLIDAALRNHVAIEISSSYKLPSLAFLKLAKAAGVKFSFGSNGRYPKMGLLDYSLEMASAIGLAKEDMFTPAPPGQKAVERRLTS
jgi:histidinol phosphatase-like PHP family hydrolase